MPLITIVMPSHNRQQYAAIAVRKIVEILPNAQIVVSDTSAEEGLEAMLPPAAGNGSVEYLRPDRPMDVVTHFEFALEHARGRYVMFLGDDDCIGPGLKDIAHWAECNDVDAVLSYGARFIANYFWPGIQSRYYGSGYESRLFVHPFTGKARRLDPPAALREVLRDPGRGLGSMPRIYHGLVSRTLIEKVRERFGALFGGLSPDIYSATLISEMARNAWQVDYPFSIPGGSPASTAGSYAARNDDRSLAKHPHTAAFADLRWDPLIPAYYAPHIMWSYSLKKAADRLGLPEGAINLARIYALSMMQHRDQISVVNAAAARARGNDLRAGPGAMLWEAAREMMFQMGRYGRRLRSPKAGGGALSFENLPDIGAAYDQLDHYIVEHGIRLELPS